MYVCDGVFIAGDPKKEKKTVTKKFDYASTADFIYLFDNKHIHFPRDIDCRSEPDREMEIYCENRRWKWILP